MPRAVPDGQEVLTVEPTDFPLVLRASVPSSPHVTVSLELREPPTSPVELRVP